MTPSRDPSIENEPHLRESVFRPDQSEQTAQQFDPAVKTPNLNEQVEQTVWDEPGLSQELTGEVPDDAVTYAKWLDFRSRRMTALNSWLATLAVALPAGLLAILGAFLGARSVHSISGIAVITIGSPVTEELMKAALALWVVEKRPFWFQSSLQIAVCLVTSGLVFAAVENLLYLFVYVDEPSELLIWWRWTICVGLHAGCSLIVGLGLIRIWRQTMQTRTPPQLTLGAPHMVIAIAIHGVYNAFCVGLALSGFDV